MGASTRGVGQLVFLQSMGRNIRHHSPIHRRPALPLTNVYAPLVRTSAQRVTSAASESPQMTFDQQFFAEKLRHVTEKSGS